MQMYPGGSCLVFGGFSSLGVVQEVFALDEAAVWRECVSAQGTVGWVVWWGGGVYTS